MKIILSHRSIPIKYEKEWVYFGSSFTKQNNVELRLKGKRIDTSKESKLEFKKKKYIFINWLEKLRLKNKDKIEWWISQMSCRNNLHSKIFLNICQLYVINKIIKKKKNILIVCEDIFLLNLLAKNLSKKNVYIKFDLLLHILKFFEIFLLFLSGLYLQCKFLYDLIKLKAFCIFNQKKKQKELLGNLVLFHHALEFNVRSYSCRYFKQLPDWFKKNGKQVYKIPWFFNKKISFKFLRDLKNNNFLIFDEWLNITDYIYIYKIFFKSFFTIKKNTYIDNINLDSLILKEKLLHLQQPSVFFLRYIPALKKMTKNVTSITSYDHFENMPFEHPLRFGLKQLNIKTKNVGFFHSLVSKNFFVYSHSKSEWQSKIKPEIVLCTGKLSKSFLIKNNIPKKIIRIAAALRQNKIKKTKIKGKNIMILLPLEKLSSIELLSKIYLNRKKIFKDINAKIVVKPHPLSNLTMLLKQTKINKIPHNWIISKKSINQELTKSFCCITMSSASAFDAIINKNIVISIKSDFDLYDNYLDILDDKNSFINSIEIDKLNNVLKNIYYLKNNEYIKSFKEIRKNLLGGLNFVNSSNLKSFII